jgi:hypothetical protein
MSTPIPPTIRVPPQESGIHQIPAQRREVVDDRRKTLVDLSPDNSFARHKNPIGSPRQHLTAIGRSSRVLIDASPR